MGSLRFSAFLFRLEFSWRPISINCGKTDTAFKTPSWKVHASVYDLLRPIMMTALVATFGLLPAALSHAIGSDSQRPMAIVIVGGLMTDLVMAFFLLPTLYLMFAKEGDIKTSTEV